MNLFDISNAISWTDKRNFYLISKEDKYELIIDYLNSGNIENLKTDIVRLESFDKIRQSKNKKKIEDYIMTEIEGFNELENGYSAYIAGAHDKSVSIQYNIETDKLSLFHPNIPKLQKFIIEPSELINLASQMIETLHLNDNLKLWKH